jgi:hypothetical protein
MVRKRLGLIAVIVLIAGLIAATLAPPASADFVREGIMTGGVVTGAGPGGGPHVRLFNTSGTLAAGFFPYAQSFAGGVYVASADVDGDNNEPSGNSDDGKEVDEIVTGAGAGGGPHVRVFRVSSGSAKTASIHSTPVSFFAYDPGFTGGVRVGGGDVTGNFRQTDTGNPVDEIITGAGPGGGPHVKVFQVGRDSGFVAQRSSFFAFSPAFTGGVFVGSTMVKKADDDEDGVVLVGAGEHGGSEVRGFTGPGSMLFTAHMFSSSANPRGGVTVAGRQAGPFWARVVAGTDQGGDPLVNVAGWAGQSDSSFLAYGPEFRGGVNVGMIDGPGGGLIVTGAGPGGGPHVKLFRSPHEVEGLHDSFFAYDSGFRGGVNVAGGEFFCDPREGACAF